MEEYYRRKYLASALSRSASFSSLAERERTRSAYRRDYRGVKEAESKFESLCAELAKAERENKKLQERDARFEEEYLEKISLNKAIIGQLKHDEAEQEDKMAATANELQALEAGNEVILDELKKIRKVMMDQQREREALEIQINEQ